METNGHARTSDFDDLYRAHYEGVVRFCRWRGRGVAPAEDLAQETFLRAYRYFDRLDPSRSPLPWLLTIARNVVNDRARSARPETPVHLLPEDPRPGHLNDDTLTLQMALASLSDRDREALRLRYVEGWDSPAAASRLGVSIDAFYQVISRARGRLRSELRRLGETVPALVLAPLRWARERVQRAGARASRSPWLTSIRPEHDAVLQVVGGFLVLLLAVGIHVGPGGGPARASTPLRAEPSPVAGAARALGPAPEVRHAPAAADTAAPGSTASGGPTDKPSKGVGGAGPGTGGTSGDAEPSLSVPGVPEVVDTATGAAQQAAKHGPKSTIHIQLPKAVEDVVDQVVDEAPTAPSCPVEGCETVVTDAVSELLP